MKHSILQGAYDMHIHSGPDIMPRKVDDMETAQRLIAAGMAGFVIKSHYVCTADRATLTNKVYPECKAFGAIELNNSVGGLNPIAVDIAGRAGAKVVWFPTVDTLSSLRDAEKMPPEKAPYWVGILKELRKDNVPLSTVDVVDENGKVLPAVYDVLDMIAKYNMILATGHISVEEVFAVVKAAHERKVERIIITHADSPLAFFEIDQQKELVSKYGVYIEHCTNGVTTGKVSYEVLKEQIRQVGCDHVINTTDLGQAGRKFPDEGMLDLVTWMLENGFSETEIRKTIVDNPIKLLS